MEFVKIIENLSRLSISINHGCASSFEFSLTLLQKVILASYHIGKMVTFMRNLKKIGKKKRK